MFSSSLTTAIRNLLRNKTFSILNLAGLISALVSFIIIRQYIHSESHYDKFQPHGENIYRISLKLFEDGKLSYQSARAYAAIAPAIKAEIPEVEDACRITPIQQVTLSYEEANKQFIERKACYADISFLKMFALEFIEGETESVLSRPFTIALSETMAQKYFGKEDAIGKTLLWNGQFDLEVTGVFKDYPKNSHLQFDFIISYPSIFETRKILSNGEETIDYSNVSWTWYIYHTYTKLKPGTDLSEFQKKLNQLYIKYSDRRVEGVRWAEFVLTPLQNIHLDSNLPFEFKNNGSRTALNMLTIVSVLILVIAWINYINMATNRSMERAKEVGIRKVLGSGQMQLMTQFLAESFLINFTALILSIIIASQLLPVADDLLQLNFSLNIFTQTIFWYEIIGVLLLGTFLSGFYPALVLSGFKPIVVLKGKFKSNKSGLLLRKGLAVFQFAISFILIVGTLLIYKQIQFMQNQELGFDLGQTLVVTSPRTGTDIEFETRKQSFSEKLKQYPYIKEVAASTYTPGMAINWSMASRWSRTAQETTQTLYCTQTDSNYFHLYKIPFVAGRNFKSTDTNKGIINESALKLLGFPELESALNEIVIVWSDSVEIVGVVKDFHQQGLEQALYPMILLSNPNRRGFFSIKAEHTNWTEVINTIEQHWKEIYPADPFEFNFLDDQFNKQYQNHQHFGQIITVFSCLSIIISCLGLYVFVSYSVLQRLKEIGVRKVLGATTGSLYMLLAKDFLIVVGIGLLIAIPVILYYSQQWLTQFAYRTTLSFSDFVFGGAILLFIVITTITYKIYQSTLTNPATTLRQE